MFFALHAEHSILVSKFQDFPPEKEKANHKKCDTAKHTHTNTELHIKSLNYVHL